MSDTSAAHSTEPTPDPGPRPEDLPLYFQFFNEIGIINQLGTAMFEARLPKGVLVSHFSVLSHLIRVQDGRTPLELARAFQVAKTTMTHTLAGLQKMGYIEMRPNPEDARSKRVWLTEEGRAFRDQAIFSLMPEFTMLATQISAQDLKALLPGLEAIRKFMDAARD